MNGQEASMRRREYGFTLIELLITLAILGVLASSAASLMQVSVQRARESELRTDLRQIRTAIDAYKTAVDQGRITKAADASGYPPDLAVLARGVVDVKSPSGHKIFFLRRIPQDPMVQSDLPPEQSWGLRSYDSDPEAPHAGDDVYDVYVPSEQAGLNGVPYRLW